MAEARPAPGRKLRVLITTVNGKKTPIAAQYIYFYLRNQTFPMLLKPARSRPGEQGALKVLLRRRRRKEADGRTHWSVWAWP